MKMYINQDNSGISENKNSNNLLKVEVLFTKVEVYLNSKFVNSSI